MARANEARADAAAACESTFNQVGAAGALPTTLTHLAFGRYFKQQLAAGALPGGLT